MQAMIILIMGINIFFSIPFLVVKILKKEKVTLLIALFFGIFAYFSLITKNSTHDLKSYYDLYETLGFYSKENFLQQKLYIVTFFTILDSLSLPKEMIPFITNFIIYFLMGKVYEKNSIFLKESKYYLFYFTLYFFLIPFSIFLGVRYFTAVSIFIYGLLIPKNKFNKIFIMSISIIVHYTMMIPLFIYFFSEIFKINLKSKKLKIILIITLILGWYGIDTIIISIYEKLNLNPMTIKVYILGKWGGEYWERLHGLRLYIYLLEQYLSLIYLFTIVYLLSYKKYRNFDYLERNFIYISLFCILVQNYRTLFDRFFIYTFILSFITIVRNINIMKTKWIKRFIFFFILILALLNFIILFERTGDIVNSIYNYSLGRIFYDVFFNFIK